MKRIEFYFHGGAKVIYGMPADEYHAVPAIGSTAVKHLAECVGRYTHERTAPRRHTEALDMGTAVHAIVLENAWNRLAVAPDDMLTKGGNMSTSSRATEWAAEQRADGAVPVTPTQYETVRAMTAAVCRHETAAQLLAQGQPEASIFWDDEDTGIPCKARIDWAGPRYAIDLKTTDRGGSSPRGFNTAVARWGHHVQDAHYSAGLAAAGIATDGLRFITVEKVAPFFVGVHRLDDDWRQYGRNVRDDALAAYLTAQHTGEWEQGYLPDNATNVATAPGWVVSQMADDIDIEIGD